MSKKKKLFVTFFSLLVIAIIVGGVVYFQQPEIHQQPGIPIPSFGPPPAEAVEGVASATPSTIPVNEATDVIVTIQITDSRLIPGSVNLQRMDASGKVLSVLGSLNDSGTNGDVVAGDKIFTIRYTFNEATTTQIYLRVSWALKGVLKRSVSNTLTVDIWQSLAEKGLTLNYPPDYQLDSNMLQLGGPISLNNFANAYHHGGLIPIGGSEIDIATIPLPTSPVSDMIAKDLQEALIQSTDTIFISGQTATRVFYKDVFTSSVAYSGIAVYIPYKTVLYKIFLSYNAGDPIESKFLTDFQQILNKLQFTQ